MKYDLEKTHFKICSREVVWEMTKFCQIRKLGQVLCIKNIIAKGKHQLPSVLGKSVSVGKGGDT